MEPWVVRKLRRAAIFARRFFLSIRSRVQGKRQPVVFRDITGHAYQEYIARQIEKTEDRAARLLGPLWQEKIDGFKDLFDRYQEILTPGARALCIGARTGQEVVVLKERGIDAVGIDLVEFKPHVLQADMHDLPFDDGEFDFVFSNVFDHSPDPERKISEMERVCRRGGHCALWLQVGYSTDPYSENLVLNPKIVLDLFGACSVVWAKRDRTVFDGMNFSILMRRI